MNKSILLLVLAGIVLSLLHAPDVMLSFAIVGGLTVLTIKLFWRMMQTFSSQHRTKSDATVKNAW